MSVPEPLTHKRIVWAGNHVQFENWCREEGIDPRDPKVYCVTTAVEAHKRLRAVVLEPGDMIVYEGTWDQGPISDFEPIWHILTEIQNRSGAQEQ